MAFFEWSFAVLILGRLYYTRTVWDSFIVLLTVVSSFAHYYLPKYHDLHTWMLVPSIFLGVAVWELITDVICARLPKE